MSDCKHKLEFMNEGDYLYIGCYSCDVELNIRNYTVISKADIEELKGMFCPKASGLDGLETFPNCGKCVVCRANQGDL